MRKYQKLTLSVLALMTFLFFNGTEANPAWQAEWERTVQAAKKEGRLRIWGGEEISHPRIVTAFNREYPFIKVITVWGSSSQLRLRIIAERRAGKYLADVWASGPSGPRMLYLNNMLDPIADTLILPEVTDQSKWYRGKHHYGDPENRHIFIYEGTPNAGMSVFYNTEKLANPGQFKSLWDIVNKWKGKILFYTYGRGGSIPTPVLMAYYDPDVGPKFIKYLFEKRDVTVSRSRRQATNWLARGKFAICFLCRDMERVKGQGLPVERLDLEKTLLGSGNSSVLTLINRAPNPNAAKVFINWYLSREGQMIYQKFMNTEILQGSDSMRIDIPKDEVVSGFRRIEGRKYKVMGFLDPKPTQKFYRDILRKRKK